MLLRERGGRNVAHPKKKKKGSEKDRDLGFIQPRSLGRKKERTTNLRLWKKEKGGVQTALRLLTLGKEEKKDSSPYTKGRGRRGEKEKRLPLCVFGFIAQPQASRPGEKRKGSELRDGAFQYSSLGKKKEREKKKNRSEATYFKMERALRKRKEGVKSRTGANLGLEGTGGKGKRGGPVSFLVIVWWANVREKKERLSIFGGQRRMKDRGGEKRKEKRGISVRSAR